jgi:hypothetical protein
MRRPPQLWEQRLARVTSTLGVGISSGDATAIVPPESPPGGGGGVEPAPVLPAPGAFIAPSAPTLIGSVQGISVVWDGLNSAGDLWPSDTSWVEVHMSTAGTAFSPNSGTLKGRLARPGGLAVTGLTAGTAYYFKLRGADPAGNYTSASAATAGSAGLITGPDIAANAIAANTIVAGTITGWSINSAYLSGGTISGGYITGGTVNGAVITSASVAGYATTGDIANFITSGQVNTNVTSISGGVITSGTIAGRTVMSASSGKRIVLDAGVNEIQFYNSSGTKTADVYPATISGNNGLGITGALDVTTLISGQQLTINGAAVDFPGVTTGSTTADAGFNGDRLRKKTSSQRYKYDIATVSGSFHSDVDADRLAQVVTVNPSAVLDLAVAEFSWLEQGLPTDSRDLGFIAEDVAQKFPLAVGRDASGVPIAVRDTPILAALLSVVRDQHNTITDLRTRIEALEA